ncbi:MAG: FdhD protein [Actinomycetota bacterium]
MATRHTGGIAKTVPDRVIVEEPLEIRLDGHRVATTMRTPGHDFELAAGFCHAEGLLAGNGVKRIRYCGTGSAAATKYNVVTVDTDRPSTEPPTPRLGVTTAACGVCGADAIEALCERLVPLVTAQPPSAEVIEAVDAAVRAKQPLFDQTGSVHGAAAFDLATGAVSVVREDIGRHNAVDKVVGRLYLDDQLPATPLGLFVSGRASFEMAQKAWAAGFGCLLAVGGPSSLAVATAHSANLALIAFVRGSTYTAY